MPKRPTVPRPVTFALNLKAVEDFKKRAQVTTDSDFARVIGINHGQMSRVLAGKALPGEGFIAGAVDAFGWRAIKDLFYIIPRDRDAAA